MRGLDPALRGRLIDAARSLAAHKNWTWRDPAEVTTGADNGEPVWVVRSNVLERGPSVRVALRRSDLSVMRAGYRPR